MSWKAEAIIHKEERRIAVWFDKNIKTNARIKQLWGVKWSQSLGAWHLPDTISYRQQFKISLDNSLADEEFINSKTETIDLQNNKLVEIVRNTKEENIKPTTILTTEVLIKLNEDRVNSENSLPIEVISNLEDDRIILKNSLPTEVFSNIEDVKFELKASLTADKVFQIQDFTKYLTTKRYSPNTIKTYSEALKSFLMFYNTKPVESINNQDVINYYQNYIIQNKLSSSYQNQIVNALKLYFKRIKETAIQIDKIYRPKNEKLLPNVLSKEEIKKILTAHNNIKHKTMLCMIYSCGLRRSELLNLKPNDIDSARNLVIIRQGKGRKDRIAPLSAAILTMLREYYKGYKPLYWLFEGQKPGEQYDERSLAQVLKQALVKTNITKPVSLHWLRHSYATHLLECGTDLRYIQEILGHKSSRTTEIYTHVSTKSLQNVKSPFDDL